MGSNYEFFVENCLITFWGEYNCSNGLGSLRALLVSVTREGRWVQYRTCVFFISCILSSFKTEKIPYLDCTEWFEDSILRQWKERVESKIGLQSTAMGREDRSTLSECEPGVSYFSAVATTCESRRLHLCGFQRRKFKLDCPIVENWRLKRA